MIFECQARREIHERFHASCAGTEGHLIVVGWHKCLRAALRCPLRNEIGAPHCIGLGQL